ncbi:beta-phosphoglucomutase [Planococcus lenghuensis]|uniref:Beta-phosphoglucomutase n=1 Tax=Planococcus lenghuensis TaxID=2213202 RepID=A0A1Q2L318_9BACL|nr:beta-phosphoglucomutase [Planococcus lenghuensis]AQQ54819.1 beta-phosphoglucomutase [Planococcus lenghuensis]
MAQQPKAFIFDLDGVITDTAEFHFLAWKQLAEEVGVIFDRKFNEQLKGVGRMDSLERILQLNPERAVMPLAEKERLAAQKNANYLELIAKTTPADILPGIEELLRTAQESGVKIALGSASKNAAFVLEKLELTHYFDYIVDAATVKNGKPHPETFTTAADALGVAYSDCVGIEDADAGVTAIKSAGMFAVGVGDAQHLPHADYRVDSTDELEFTDIIRRYEEHQAAD